MSVLVATAIIGTGLQVYGQLKSAKENASLLRQQAAINEIRATELLQRAEINNEITRERSGQVMGEAVASSAGRGVDISSQSTMMALEEVARLAVREITLNNREARFEANMMRIEGESSKRAADQTQKAGYINAGTTIATNTADILKSRPGEEKTSLLTPKSKGA